MTLSDSLYRDLINIYKVYFNRFNVNTDDIDKQNLYFFALSIVFLKLSGSSYLGNTENSCTQLRYYAYALFSKLDLSNNHNSSIIRYVDGNDREYKNKIQTKLLDTDCCANSLANSMLRVALKIKNSSDFSRNLLSSIFPRSWLNNS